MSMDGAVFNMMNNRMVFISKQHVHAIEAKGYKQTLIRLDGDPDYQVEHDFGDVLKMFGLEQP